MKTPFTQDQVNKLNEYQIGEGHPFTCPSDGDAKHILYEFGKKHPSKDYQEYIKEQKDKGIIYPEMEFNQTSLMATKEGWICLVCGYRQNWAHPFMSQDLEKKFTIDDMKKAFEAGRKKDGFMDEYDYTYDDFNKWIMNTIL